MSKGIIAIAVVGVVVIGTLVIGGLWIGTSNSEIRLRNQIKAVQTDNKNEFDNMWKKIEQTVEVTKAERQSVENIIIGYASERGGGGGAFINAVHEALPNIDSSTFKNLQNVIISSRDRFTQRQKQLIDLQREHNNLIETFPSSIFVGHRGYVDIVVVTSGKTEETFQTGQDNNVDLGL